MDISTVHHFADDTNLLLTVDSLKELNKHINRGLKSVTGKTKTVIFKSKNKKITTHINFRISRQKIVPVDSVEHLGFTLKSDLHWKTHYVPKFLLKTIYYSILNSHLIYGCEVWGQNQNNVLAQRLQKPQEKAMCLILICMKYFCNVTA